MGLFSRKPTVKDLSPAEVARGLTEGKIMLVDVREPNEVAAAAYPDAIQMPMSQFDPSALPDPAGKQVVFACGSGKRSMMASLAAQEAGLSYDAHLEGGMKGWREAGLPTRQEG
jgi:rhodanese-related sulfurtransferase